MSFVSLSDACRELGIDGKTLHRWLAQAHLPLLAHPRDGRKQGLSQTHLEALAAQHHRALPSPSPLLSPSVGALPADLLSLPEQVAGLQSQLSALQQQVAALQTLLESSLCAPVAWTPACPKASKSGQGLSEPVAKAAVATPARKPGHVLPRLEYGGEGRYVVISPTEGVMALQADSAAWFTWLSQQSAFRFVGKLGHFTAHYYAPGGTRVAWRAHRTIRNHTCNRRLGRTNDLTVAVLEQAAAQFQALLK